MDNKSSISHPAASPGQTLCVFKGVYASLCHSDHIPFDTEGGMMLNNETNCVHCGYMASVGGKPHITSDTQIKSRFFKETVLPLKMAKFGSCLGSKEAPSVF